MSSETIVTALFLIAAVVAAGVLINAVFPIISRTTETFGTVAHSTDDQIRTDIKIVNYFANNAESQIWLKNVGTSRIPEGDLENSIIFFGRTGNFGTVSIAPHDPKGWWNPGNTLHFTITKADLTSVEQARWPTVDNKTAYFAIVLPNGVKRTIEFESDVTNP